jgi:hypothetical protein
VTKLRWRTGALGCLLPVMVLATALFGLAALRPELVAEMADQRRGGWLAWTAAVTVAGVNLPVAAIALYLAWETFRFGWRWADQVAVTAGDFGLVPHRSTFLPPMPWAEIEDVRFVRIGRAPTLLVQLRGGRSRAIRGVDNEGEAAERFAAAARERVGR